jgi:ketosteroid isomerase-like protein
MPHSDLMRKYFSAYEDKDCKAVESLLTDGFVFSSPYDDHTAPDIHFKRCWPYSEKSAICIIEALFEKSREAFIHGLFDRTDPWP